MYKVLFTGCTFDDEEISALRAQDLEIIGAPKDLDDKELIGLLQGVDAVISNGGEYYTADILSKCPNLKFIQFFGIGYSKCIDIEVAKQYNKIVLNTPKVNSYSVAEFTLGLIFALNQKILQHNSDTRNGLWEERSFFDLKDKTIGIIGMGHIGTIFAELVYNAFHAKILYYDILDREEVEAKYHAKKVSLEQLFCDSDIVSLHLPLNDDTRNLIGKNELSLMKESAYFINTARAEIVDSDSLYEVLENKKIAGCAFDGFYSEPVDFSKKESKLLSLPDGCFLLTPHTGYNAIEGEGRVEKMCIENLLQVFQGNDCSSIINR